MEDDFFGGLVEGLPIALTVIDEAGRITYASPGTEEMTGYAADEVVGRNLLDFLLPDGIANLSDGLSYVAEHPDVLYGPVWVSVRHADGQGRVLEIMARNRFADPRVRGLVVVGRDHTTQVRLNDALTSHDANADRGEVLGLLAEAALGLPVRGRAGFVDLDDGRPQAPTRLPDGVLGPAPEGARPRPWQLAVASGEGQYPPTLEGFDPVMREAAAADGIATVWAVPVPELAPSSRSFASCLVVGRLAERESTINERLHLDRIAQYAALVFEREHHLDELSREARTDDLTGLANRAHLLRPRTAVATDSPSGQLPEAVLYVDLDDFKPVNDAFGHAVGDEVLRVVAERLAQACRRDDEVGRLGGDEFLVLVWRADPGDVDAIARRILEVVARPIVVTVDDRDHEVRVGASIGIARPGPVGAHGLVGLVRAADEALYRAKRAGGGRWQEARG